MASSAFSSLSMRLLRFLVISAAIALVTCDGQYFELHISKAIIASDCFPRVSTVVNGTSPGPTLHLYAGQQVTIKVVNDMTEEDVTIHWHGLLQRLSPWSDGVPYITQKPIPANGGFYMYNFQLLATDHGTFFYHSHYRMSSTTNYGGIIIHPPVGIEPPYKYDEERTVMLGEAYPQNDEMMHSEILGKPFVWLGDPQTLLLNGKTLATNCNQTMLDQLDTKDKCRTDCGWATVQVQADRTYRLHLIGSQHMSTIEIAIDHHQMELVELDGQYVKSVHVKSVVLGSGQRASVLVRTKSQSNGAFWIKMLSKWRPNHIEGYGLLVYGNETVTSLRPQPNQGPNIGRNNSWQETFAWGMNIFEPLADVKPPDQNTITHQVLLEGRQHNTDNGSVRWSVSGRDMPEKPPTLASLWDIHQATTSNETLVKTMYQSNIGAYIFPLNAVVEVAIQNTRGLARLAEAHPWHTHGNRFWVMAMGSGQYNRTAAWEMIANGTSKPHIRDTALLYPSPGKYDEVVSADAKPGDPAGWMLLVMTLDNWGIWLVHCHVTAHLVMGMGTLFAVGIDHIPAQAAQCEERRSQDCTET